MCAEFIVLDICLFIYLLRILKCAVVLTVFTYCCFEENVCNFAAQILIITLLK